MVYVVIACHFRIREGLCGICGTTIARLQAALNAAREGDHVIVTGDVPYAPGGPTLGKLMRNWLVKSGFSTEAVSVLHGGVGTFSEARIVCELLKSKEEITVVSSSWYFFQGETNLAAARTGKQHQCFFYLHTKHRRVAYGAHLCGGWYRRPHGDFCRTRTSSRRSSHHVSRETPPGIYLRWLQVMQFTGQQYSNIAGHFLFLKEFAVKAVNFLITFKKVTETI